VNPEIQVLADGAALYEAAAATFQRVTTESVRERGVCRVALAGGSTPKGLYELLASDSRWRDAVPWDGVEWFWGDERHVGPDHSDSNYRLAEQAMLSRVPVRPPAVHRVPAEHPDANVAADLYEADIRASFLRARTEDAVPRFDLILLGLGTDAHTASLFPGTRALEERERLVVANRVEKLATDRITMTFPLLNAGRVVTFLVAGSDKAEAVRAVLDPDPAAPPPAALVRPAAGRLIWLLDRPAAARLA
jgi:6-phosphogluconolactonase